MAKLLIVALGVPLRLPFGPYLAGGAVLWVFYGPQWLNWYLDRTTLQQPRRS
jgi:prepilin signal peptidase PulO-like enzyme (type II secretory pathway)